MHVSAPLRVEFMDRGGFEVAVAISQGALCSPYCTVVDLNGSYDRYRAWARAYLHGVCVVRDVPGVRP